MRPTRATRFTKQAEERNRMTFSDVLTDGIFWLGIWVGFIFGLVVGF